MPASWQRLNLRIFRMKIRVRVQQVALAAPTASYLALEGTSN